MRTLKIVEVVPRDGPQNETAPVPTEAKVAFVDALSAAGVSEIEVNAFVSPRQVPQLADAREVFRRTSVSSMKLIWLTLVKRIKASCPTFSQRFLSWIESKALKEAEPMLRRLTTLIFAGWLPHEYVSSRSCLYLFS